MLTQEQQFKLLQIKFSSLDHLISNLEDDTEEENHEFSSLIDGLFELIPDINYLQLLFSIKKNPQPVKGLINLENNELSFFLATEKLTTKIATLLIVFKEKLIQQQNKILKAFNKIKRTNLTTEYLDNLFTIKIETDNQTNSNTQIDTQLENLSANLLYLLFGKIELAGPIITQQNISGIYLDIFSEPNALERNRNNLEKMVPFQIGLQLREQFEDEHSGKIPNTVQVIIGRVILFNYAKKLIQENKINHLVELLYADQGETKSFYEIFNFLSEQQKLELLEKLLEKESPDTFLRGRSCASLLIEHIKQAHIEQYKLFKNQVINLVKTLIKKYSCDIDEIDGVLNTHNSKQLSMLIRELISSLIELPHPIYLYNICYTISSSLDVVKLTKQLNGSKETYISIYLITKCLSHLLLETANAEEMAENPNQRHTFKLISKLIQVLANPTEEVKNKHADIAIDILDSVCQENNMLIYLAKMIPPKLETSIYSSKEIDLTEQLTATETDNTMSEIDLKSKYFSFKFLFESCQDFFLKQANKITNGSTNNLQINSLVRRVKHLACSQDSFYEFLQMTNQLIIIAKKDSFFNENKKKYQKKIEDIKSQINQKIDPNEKILEDEYTQQVNSILQEMINEEQRQKKLIEKLRTFYCSTTILFYFYNNLIYLLQSNNLGNLEDLQEYEKINFAFKQIKAIFDQQTNTATVIAHTESLKKLETEVQNKINEIENDINCVLRERDNNLSSTCLLYQDELNYLQHYQSNFVGKDNPVRTNSAAYHLVQTKIKILEDMELLNQTEYNEKIADINHACYLAITPLKQKIEKFKELLAELQTLKRNFERFKTKSSMVNTPSDYSLFSTMISSEKTDANLLAMSEVTTSSVPTLPH